MYNWNKIQELLRIKDFATNAKLIPHEFVPGNKTILKTSTFIELASLNDDNKLCTVEKPGSQPWFVLRFHVHKIHINQSLEFIPMKNESLIRFISDGDSWLQLYLFPINQTGMIGSRRNYECIAVQRPFGDIMLNTVDQKVINDVSKRELDKFGLL
jgi:hypothetical protein